MEDIMVSIFCPTYNHEKYIKKCLDGFVFQKTNFKFEALVFDDCSTDNTRQIIKEYAAKYPDIIKPILPQKNIVQNEGWWALNMTAFEKVRGKYYIICEGDDYFTDENKLQKQVDFLENNPSYAGCFHPVEIVYDDGEKSGLFYPKKKLMKGKKL